MEEKNKDKLLRDCTVGDVKDFLNKSTEDFLKEDEPEEYDYIDSDGALCELSIAELKFMKDHDTFQKTYSVLLSKPIYVGKDEAGDWLVIFKQ